MGIIYKIRNVMNEKCLVGSTKNKKNLRKNQHWSLLRNNKHKNPHLQNSWNKYGEINFTFEVIEECENLLLLERELFWKNNLKAEYNIAPIDRPLGTINLGRKHTPETIEKMKLAHKNHKMPTWFGPYMSKIRMGKNNPMYGKTGNKNPKFAGYFMWQHIDGFKETLSQMEMVKKYNLQCGNLYRVVVGKRKSHKGWFCLGKVI